MTATIHALLLLAIGGLALAIPIRRRVVGSWRLMVWSVVPCLLVGVLSALTLNAGGKPVLEWLLPTAAAFSASLFFKSKRLSIAFAAAMFLVAVLLSMNFLNLVAGPYTASPARVERSAVTKRLWHTFFTRLRAVERAE